MPYQYLKFFMEDDEELKRIGEILAHTQRENASGVTRWSGIGSCNDSLLSRDDASRVTRWLGIGPCEEDNL